MEKSKTQKGKDMRFHEGYRYKFAARTSDDSVSWRCLKGHSCGRIKILDDVIAITSEHNHAPDPEKIEAVKAVVGMRERAAEEFGRPRQIIQNCTQGVSMEAVVLLPSYNACQRTIE